MKLEVHKTHVLGMWYVTPKNEADVLGTFREYKDAQLFAHAPDMYEALVQLADDKGRAYWTPEEVRQIARTTIMDKGGK